ncbi:MAG TPA: WD40 repeat domain-containing protein [Gemmataceae bacterium]|nr:WD40 repeat domain-containing protein [Gemmataceae bacterium]
MLLLALAAARAAAAPPENKTKPAVDHFGDPLPERAVVRLGTIRFRMGGLLYACAYSPDGKTLAAATGGDHDIYLFDPAAGKLIRKLPHLIGHVAEMTCIAYSPDGRTLASGGDDGVLILRDAATGKMLRQLKAPKGSIHSLVFSRDGGSLFSSGGDSPIRVWDAAAGKEKPPFAGSKDGADCLVLSPDGRTIASNGGGNVQLWDTATGKLIRRLTTQKRADDAIESLAFSPDGKLLAAGSQDCTIELLDPSTGKVERRLPEDSMQIKAPLSWVHSLAFSPDGKTLAAGCADHTLSLWVVAAGRKLREHPGVDMVFHHGRQKSGIPAIVFSPDGRRLAFAQDNRLGLLDARSGAEVLPFEGHRGAIQKVFFGPSGQRLITLSDDPARQVLEWDAATGRLIRPMGGKIIQARVADLSPDRKTLVSTWWGDTSAIRFWDTTTGKEIRKIPLPPNPSTTPGAIVFSPDGKLLAVEDFKGETVWLYDAATGKQLSTVEEMGTSRYGASESLAFSPDGRLLAAAGGTKIHLAEVPSGRQLLRINLPKESNATAIAISADGRTLAVPSHVVSGNQTITLWESASGKERLVLPCPGGQVNNVAFSPDGRLLAAGGYDSIVFVWDMIAGKQMARLEGHQGSVNSLAFSPDGRRLASGSQDTTALFWDVSGLAKALPRRGPLSQKELDELWSTLAGADAAKAYQAILTLEAVPDQAVPLLAERLRLSSNNDKQITRLLALLDSDDFAQRERATKELQEIGWLAEPALHKALEDKPSLEMRRRVKALLDGIRKQPLPPAMLRMLRGMEVLEHIGTPEARKVMASLAAGTPQARLTREAKAALQRLR